MKNSFIRSLKTKQRVVIISSLVLFISIVSFVLYQDTKKIVKLNANGETIEVVTHANTVKQLLLEKNIEVAKHDQVAPSLNTKIVNGLTISWKQAKEVTISVNGNQSKVWTTKKYVKDILKDANIEVSERDTLVQSLESEIGTDNRIDIQKAFQVSLIDGFKKSTVWSTATTVANFLEQQGVQLNEFDRVESDLEDILTPRSTITVVRVEKDINVVKDTLDFAVEKKQDATLQKGREEVVNEGEKGTISRTYEIVKENGHVVATYLQSEKVLKEPKNQLIAVGTKTEEKEVRAATISSGPSESSESIKPDNNSEFYVTATAYTAYCKGCSGTTATGINLRSGSVPGLKVIAVDPSVIKLGSKVWVEGYGLAVAEDTGGAIKGNKIDIFVQSETEARNWGVKKVRIKVFE
ncbi:G5 and 3D domain-containing protein [Lysinibacillus irui]|uniref:Ubiquitin-like domain-containing protein n=1 Tax=Lysinibacillus irui TaxID=2998077 RepID=A0AAJ5RWW5_9BACI|nr:G5 and 3D domain-containing protein [Lysinibacillus irui]WDV09215.1 ubiquitin-like domain-containing protein [Lysinibacillus irui]